MFGKATREGKAILLTGNIMGGGPYAFAIGAHLEADFPVYATEQAALTIHDNIEKVKAFGIRIVSEEEARKLASEENALNIALRDFDPEAVSSALRFLKCLYLKIMLWQCRIMGMLRGKVTGFTVLSSSKNLLTEEESLKILFTDLRRSSKLLPE